MAAADVSPDVFISILRQYDTDMFRERAVTTPQWHMCVLSAIPWDGIFASKHSALHGHHAEEQTHKAWGSKDTNSGCQALCLRALLTSPFLRQLHEVGIA